MVVVRFSSQLSQSADPVSVMMFAVFDAAVPSDVVSERFLAANSSVDFRAAVAEHPALTAGLRLDLLSDAAARVRAAAAVGVLASVLSGPADEGCVGALRQALAVESEVQVLFDVLSSAPANIMCGSPAGLMVVAECMSQLTAAVAGGAVTFDDVASAASIAQSFEPFFDVRQLAFAVWQVHAANPAEEPAWASIGLWASIVRRDPVWVTSLVPSGFSAYGELLRGRLAAVAGSAVAYEESVADEWVLLAKLFDFLVFAPLAVAVAEAGSPASVPGVVVADLEMMAVELLGAVEPLVDVDDVAHGAALSVVDSVVVAFELWVTPSLEVEVAVFDSRSVPVAEMDAETLAQFVSASFPTDVETALNVLQHPDCPSSAVSRLSAGVGFDALSAVVSSCSAPVAAVLVCRHPALLGSLDPSVRASTALRVLSSRELLGRLDVDRDDGLDVAVALAAEVDPDRFGELPCSLAGVLVQVPCVRAWVAAQFDGMSATQLRVVAQFAAAGSADGLSFDDLLSVVPSAVAAPAV